MNNSGKPEVLAPAGDFVCLQAAIDAGADAVYFGLGTFNMRARSGVNFAEADLPEVARRCRAAGVKAYLALNAIMFEGETDEIERTIVAAKPFVDAFIVSDWGVIALCRKHGAEYLAAQGNYAAFGIVGYEGYDWSESRVASFGTALSGMGYACDALRVKRANLHDGSVHEKMREWAARLHRPAAVMAACDELGRAFIDALVAGGVRVPQDVAVLGVDNEGILCTHMSPTLSSIQPDFERSGFLAAECMDAFLQRPAKASAPPMRRISPVRGIIGRESTAPASATGRMVLKAEEFIRRHAGENIHVDEVARHLGVSRRLFDLRFREVTGRTALDAIHAEQLESVRHLLRTTSLSITEISRICNFRSENHLKRLFKQAFGQTMSDYRNAENTNRTAPA